MKGLGIVLRIMGGIMAIKYPMSFISDTEASWWYVPVGLLIFGWGRNLYNDSIKEENSYLLFNKNYPEDSRFEDISLEEIRKHLKDFFETAFMIVNDNDERLEDKFRYCSKSRYDSIDKMTFDDMKDVFEKEFDWKLEIIKN